MAGRRWSSSFRAAAGAWRMMPVPVKLEDVTDSSDSYSIGSENGEGVAPAGHTTDHSNLLDQDIALDRHPLAADISDGGPSFMIRIPPAQKSDDGKTALQYQVSQAGHHAKISTLQEQNIASERSNRHPLAADINDGGLSFVNRITNQIPAVQKSDAGKTTIQYQVTPAYQVSENEILQKNILRVVSIRHSLAQINNGGPKFIESRNTNQFPTTNGTKLVQLVLREARIATRWRWTSATEACRLCIG
ncbi:hypothetical protein quinque_007842 [Culex quinquefasciatus]